MRTYLLLGAILVSLHVDVRGLCAQDAPSAFDRFERAAAGEKTRLENNDDEEPTPRSPAPAAAPLKSDEETRRDAAAAAEKERLETAAFAKKARADAAAEKERREAVAAAEKEKNLADAKAKKDLQTQKAKQSIKQAVAVLFPGGVPEGSPREEQLSLVVDTFIGGSAPDTLDQLRTMVANDPDLPPAELLMAGLAFAVGKNPTGLAILESSAIEYPDHPGVYLSFAQLAINAKRITDASLHADRAARMVQAGDFSPVAAQHFKKQYYEIVTNIRMLRNQTDLADQSLERLQATEQGLPFYFFNKARLAFLDGQTDQTLRLLNQHAQAKEADDNDRLPELTLVDWFRAADKPLEAERLLLETIDRHPDNVAALKMTAELYLSKENFVDALKTIELYQKASGGENITTLEMKGRIAFAGLSYTVAAQNFQNFAKLSPNNPAGVIMLSLSLIESERPDMRKNAQAIAEQVAQRMSQNLLAVATLGYIYQKNGLPEKADPLMRRVAAASNGSPEISWFLAYWLAKKGKKEDAIKLLEVMVETKGLFIYRTAARKLLADLK